MCDILDQLGYCNQAMHQRLCSLDDQCCTFVGRARTARRIDVDYYHPENPYGKEIEFMDSLKENDVVVHMGRTDVDNSKGSKSRGMYV